MQTPSDAASRRRFLKLTGGAVALIPLVNLYGCGDGDGGRPMPEPEPEAQPGQAPPATPDTRGGAPDQSPAAQGSPQSQPVQQPAAQPAGQPAAGDLERIEESDQIAQQLSYKHSAEEVEHQLYEPGETCANCLQYQPELGDDEQWGGCRVIPGKLVNADGWCQVWVARQT